MDKLRFAHAVGGWLFAGAVVVWACGPLAAYALPARTGCTSAPKGCEPLIAMLQHASAIVVTALLAFVFLRLCYRRIADSGRSGAWQLPGVLPSLCCCREIMDGALSSAEMKLLYASWPDFSLKAPIYLATGILIAALIGLLPGAARPVAPPAT